MWIKGCAESLAFEVVVNRLEADLVYEAIDLPAEQPLTRRPMESIVRQLYRDPVAGRADDLTGGCLAKRHETADLRRLWLACDICGSLLNQPLTMPGSTASWRYVTGPSMRARNAGRSQAAIGAVTAVSVHTVPLPCTLRQRAQLPFTAGPKPGAAFAWPDGGTIQFPTTNMTSPGIAACGSCPKRREPDAPANKMILIIVTAKATKPISSAIAACRHIAAPTTEATRATAAGGGSGQHETNGGSGPELRRHPHRCCGGMKSVRRP
jgi:hypothetical protein